MKFSHSCLAIAVGMFLSLPSLALGASVFEDDLTAGAKLLATLDGKTQCFGFVVNIGTHGGASHGHIGIVPCQDAPIFTFDPATKQVIGVDSELGDLALMHYPDMAVAGFPPFLFDTGDQNDSEWLIDDQGRLKDAHSNNCLSLKSYMVDHTLYTVECKDDSTQHFGTSKAPPLDATPEMLEHAGFAVASPATSAPTASTPPPTQAPQPEPVPAPAPGPDPGPLAVTEPVPAPAPGPDQGTPAVPAALASGPAPGPASVPAPGSPALQAKSHGDPHFKTFSGIKFDFHGGCDLVLFENSNFVDGLGVSVHVRTKIKTWWSYIKSAVLRVGKNTLEVMGGIDGGQFWINGKEQMAPKDGAILSLSGLQVSFHRISNKQFRFRLDFGQGDAIAIETFKSFVSVNTRVKTDRFKGSVGLLGSFPKGKMLARDGKTLVEDADSFGKEWQVLASEPMLFHSVEGPQHPQECAMPDKAATKTKKRRLGETLITEEDAAIACARVDEDDKDACIFDVLATNDKEMAGSY